MFEINTIVSIVIALAIIFTLAWYFGRDLNKADAYKLLDISLLSLLFVFVLARIAGIIYFRDQIEVTTWAFSPVTQPEEQILFFNDWPWQFFQINDGRFLFLEPFSAFIVIDYVLRTFHQRRESSSIQISIYRVAITIIAVALVPFQVTSILNSYLGKDFSIQLPVIAISLTIFAILLLFSVVKNKATLLMLIMATQLSGIIAANVLLNDKSKDMLPLNIFYAILITLTVFRLFLDRFSGNRPAEEKQTLQRARTWRERRFTFSR